MEEVVIRRVRLEDIPKVVDIQVSGWQSAYRGIVEDSYLDTMSKQEKIQKRMKDYNQTGFIVAVMNNEVVGFCRYVFNNALSSEIESANCELLALYVKPDLKRNGIGRKMFEYVTNDFKEAKKTNMVLWCLKDNYPSRKFYEKMGGRFVYERPVRIGDKDYAEVCYEYEI